MSFNKDNLPRGKVRLFWTLLVSSLVLGSIKLLDRSEPGLNVFPKYVVNEHQQKEMLKFSFYRVLFDFGIRVDWISGDSYYKTVHIPKDLAIVEPYAGLVTRFLELGGTLLKAESNPLGDKKVIEVGLNQESLFQLTLVEDSKISRVNGEIAIVIDDFGNSFRSWVEDFLNLEQTVTVSILPGLRYSEKIAQAAFERKLDVMVHLPMEPQNGRFKSDDFMLLTNMEEEEIRRRIRKAIRSVPHAKGLNNHMGSLATIDEQLLSTTMDEIKQAGMFFLDSRTNPKSLGYSVAQSKKIPCGMNDTFLDAIEEEPFIRQQVNLLAEIASRNGQAIGIGHPNKVTLKVLQEELPKLEKRGFQFVSVSELVKLGG